MTEARYSAQVSGRLLGEADVTIPYGGIWMARVSVEGPGLLSTDARGAEVRLGALSLLGTVVHQGALGGGIRALVVGGAGTWGHTVASRVYRTPGGVAVSTVVRDLATELGELVAETPAGARFGGDHLVRPRCRGVDVLRLLRPLGLQWWVDTQGRAHVAEARSPVPVRQQFLVESRDADDMSFRVVPDAPEEWLPGATFSPPAGGVYLVSSSRIRYLRDGQANVEILATNAA